MSGMAGIRSGSAPSPSAISRCRPGSKAATLPTRSSSKRAFPKHSDARTHGPVRSLTGNVAAPRFRLRPWASATWDCVCPRPSKRLCRPAWMPCRGHGAGNGCSCCGPAARLSSQRAAPCPHYPADLDRHPAHLALPSRKAAGFREAGGRCAAGLGAGAEPGCEVRFGALARPLAP